VALALLLGALPALAEAPTAAEYQVKAAFLYNFVKFVDWPARALEGQETIVIGVVGEGPLAPTLERTLEGKTVGARRIVARRVALEGGPPKCHVLFIGSSAAAETAEILKRLAGSSVLTVGENEHFAESGGMIGFKMEADKVRFDINRDAAEQAGLRLNAQLLRLASNVIGGSTGR
jgi:hypothetical protein